MKIVIINGPNLNLLGTREVDIYGNESFESFFEKIKNNFPSIQFEYFQSNIEGEIINAIQQFGFEFNGIVLNPAGYSHTSVAIGDAIATIKCPVVEVHISNIFARENFRKLSHVTAKAVGCIAGLGMYGYELAIQYLVNINSNK